MAPREKKAKSRSNVKLEELPNTKRLSGTAAEEVEQAIRTGEDATARAAKEEKQRQVQGLRESGWLRF